MAKQSITSQTEGVKKANMPSSGLDGMFVGHLKDLAERSWQNNQYTFTNFLDEAQISVLFSIEKELSYAGLTLSGGSEHAGRCVARFGREDVLGYSQPFPISCLRVDPVAEKFGEALSHRDYLGALMSLGVKRELLGDIYVHEKSAYVFCLDHIAEFIKENLISVRHTNVSITILDEVPEMAGPVLKDKTIIAGSERLDAVIAQVYNVSRSQSLGLFTQGKVFVNGKQITNNSITCHPDDKISVRGYGKFLYDGLSGTTGKGRCRIQIRIYQ